MDDHHFKEFYWRDCSSPKFPHGPNFQRPLHKVNVLDLFKKSLSSLTLRSNYSNH